MNLNFSQQFSSTNWCFQIKICFNFNDSMKSFNYLAELGKNNKWLSNKLSSNSQQWFFIPQPLRLIFIINSSRFLFWSIIWVFQYLMDTKDCTNSMRYHFRLGKKIAKSNKNAFQLIFPSSPAFIFHFHLLCHSVQIHV